MSLANVLEVTGSTKDSVAAKFPRLVERWGLPLELVKDSPLSLEDEVLALCDPSILTVCMKAWGEVPVYTSLAGAFDILETVSRSHTIFLNVWGRWYVYSEEGMHYFIALLR